MSFFSELKRRNVIRVGILYGVSAWLLLQLTDVLSSLLPVPEWTGSLVFLLLAIGFFPVMIFAWAYELTPEGIKRDKDVDRSASITGDTGRRINTLIVVLLVVAIGVVGLDRLLPGETGKVSVVSSAIADDRPSIAVLPFADLSREKDQEYFTDGISEELLNVLVRVDGLRVASRTSAFAFRDSGLSVPQIAKELKVGHVLEGSVRKDGDHIRITAQLIRADGDEHLWSENYDRELKDIFKVQDEIAKAIVQQLAASLGVGDKSAQVEVIAATDNLDAYELYLKARELFGRRERIDQSVALYKQAIALDPNFARAWEGLAAAETVWTSWESPDGLDHDKLAEEAARKALEIDPELSMPYAVLGSYEEIKNLDWIAAMDYYDRAIAKDSKNTTAWLWRGMLQRELGFLKAARDDFQRCLDIDPLYLNCEQHLAMNLWFEGQDDMAMQLIEHGVLAGFHSVTPNVVPLYVGHGQLVTAALLAVARKDDSGVPVKELVDALQNPQGDHSAGLVRFREWASRIPTERQPGFSLYGQFLVAAHYYDEITAFSGQVLWSPASKSFRQSEQFKKLARENNVLKYWQERGFPPQCEAVGKDSFRCD